ncbi:MAG: RdgB/HAM1 family non-canonical purine NTP pyrophosphatase [Oscillospiraceae bacterium]|nr:RdgB/HAM1 family non-canonical purine NTP pyrophosphatase [Oscillospiraceae bacterium]
MKFVLASNNAHKLEEIGKILSTLGIEVVPQKELGISIDPDETGETFEENSYIKAKAVMDACGLPTIADDSGLMVEALGGAPGVYTARYGGEKVRTDRERYEYLLKQMEGIPQEQRGAKFVTVITLLFPDGRKVVARGECPGRILFVAAGENGFGYDPVFYSNDAGNSFALLPPEVKNSLSHRARALKALVEKIREENIL